MYNKHLHGTQTWQYGCLPVPWGTELSSIPGSAEIRLDIDSKQVMLSGHPAPR
jgi:hypothetical protein